MNQSIYDATSLIINKSPVTITAQATKHHHCCVSAERSELILFCTRCSVCGFTPFENLHYISDSVVRTGGKKNKNSAGCVVRVTQTQPLRRVCVPGAAKFSEVAINVYVTPRGCLSESSRGGLWDISVPRCRPGGCVCVGDVGRGGEYRGNTKK